MNIRFRCLLLVLVVGAQLYLAAQEQLPSSSRPQRRRSLSATNGPVVLLAAESHSVRKSQVGRTDLVDERTAR